MIARKLLIPLRKEYPALRKVGRWRDSASFRLLIAKRPTTAESTRYAFIVSKKVSLLSTERHEIKRRLSDAVTLLLDQIPSGMDIVVIAKKEALGKTAGELKKELGQLI